MSLTKVPLEMLSGTLPGVVEPDVFNAVSRTDAIANYHPDVGPPVIVTHGYYTAGDKGGAIYKRVLSEPLHSGKFSIVLSNAVTTVWYEISMPVVTPDMFGAKGDDPGDGTGTDDRLAFQSAFNYSRFTSLSPARTYRINGTLYIPRFQQIRGVGGRSSSGFFVETGQTSATRLVFTGSGTSCWENQDPTLMLSHGALGGFDMYVKGTYTYMMFFRDLLSFELFDIGMETASTTMQGLWTRKILDANPSWLNQMINVSIRLPDNSTGAPLDVDWSDSAIERSQFTGGSGSIDRGYGIRFVNCQIERSNYAGLIILKTGTVAAKNTSCSNCTFDANKTHGILFLAQSDTSGTKKFHTTITGNHFRTEDPNTGTPGGATIGFINTAGGTYTVGPITGNQEQSNLVPQFSQTGSWSTPSNTGNMQA